MGSGALEKGCSGIRGCHNERVFDSAILNDGINLDRVLTENEIPSRKESLQGMIQFHK